MPEASPSYKLHATTNVFAEGTWQTSFSASATHTIFIAVDILTCEISRSHRHRVVIYAPAGWEYQSVDQSLSPGEIEADTTSRRIWCAFPVTRTIIQDYAIYGEWRAVVFVDDIERASLSFTINA